MNKHQFNFIPAHLFVIGSSQIRTTDFAICRVLIGLDLPFVACPTGAKPLFRKAKQ